MDADASWSQSQLHLPEDIIIMILKKLPIKAKLRFKTVCKSWLALILHPEFHRKTMLLPDTRGIRSLGKVPVLVNYSRSATLLIQTSKWKVTHYELPFKPESVFHEFWIGRYAGPCSGVYLIHDIYGTMVLWNYATQEYKILSQGNYAAEPCDVYMDLGLGTEVMEDGAVDFLILRFCFEEFCDDKVPKLYRVSTGSWKYLPHLPHCTLKNPHEVVNINCVFYWLLFEEAFNYVASLDTRTETFVKLDLPDSLRNLRGWQTKTPQISCFTIGGTKSLAITIGKTNLWVLRERDGNRFWVEEKIILYNSDKDIERKTLVDPKAYVWQNNFVQYEESLVSFH